MAEALVPDDLRAVTVPLLPPASSHPKVAYRRSQIVPHSPESYSCCTLDCPASACPKRWAAVRACRAGDAYATGKQRACGRRSIAPCWIGWKEAAQLDWRRAALDSASIPAKGMDRFVRKWLWIR